MRTLMLLATFCVAMILTVPAKAQPRCKPVMDFYYVTTGAPDSLIKGRQSRSAMLDTACKVDPQQLQDLRATADLFSRPVTRSGS